MPRAAPRLTLWIALAGVLACLGIPVASMMVRSFRIEEVVTTRGDVYVAAGEVRFFPATVEFPFQDRPGATRTPVALPRSDVLEVRSRFSLHHYRAVLGDPRARALLKNSIEMALGAAAAALLLGLPLAWVLGRADLPGRRLLGVMDVGPAILPPFLVAMGVSRPLGTFLHGALGLEGERLQLVNSWLIFGFVLHPIVVLLVSRALAGVPAGPWEAALLARGRGAATRHVVLPAVLPAVAGSGVLVFALALADFGVPDLLSFLLPPTGQGVQVFPREIQVQWATDGNHARAVATGAPLTLVTLALLAVALPLLARTPALAAASGRRRPRAVLGARGRSLAYGVFVVVLALSLILPLASIASWGTGHGDTAAQGGGGVAADRPAASGPGRGRLFEFADTLRNTPGIGEEWARWVRTAVAAAVAATLLAVPLARWAARGGRTARGVVLGIGAVSLAVPGLVIGVGTLLAWQAVGLSGAGNSVRAMFALVGRLLPFALLPAWLALREVPRGLEEAGAVLGAPPAVRARRLWWPMAQPGVLAGTLLVLLLALRELDAIVLIQPQVFPLRLYEKIHFSRLADEANLAFFYVGHLLLPALLLAAWMGRRGSSKPPAGR